VLALALLWIALPSKAQTPDGQTPAEETVCDGLGGGLFGLCNAYCEAMDCDGPDPHASNKACEKVRQNFERASGGAAPPCAETPVVCPCLFPILVECPPDGSSCFGDLVLDLFCGGASIFEGVQYIAEDDSCRTVTGSGIIELEATTLEESDACREVIGTLAPSFGSVCPAP
jgi:hypothetical protein